MTSKDVNIADFDHYADILGAELERRKRINSRFSLRAFARQLDVSPSTLSEIIARKHGLSRPLAAQVAMRLGYPPEEQQYFIDLFDYIHSTDVPVRESAYGRLQTFRNNHRDRILQEDEFQLISNWYHLAILELAKVETFQFDYDWIALKLGISPLEAMSAVNRLKRLGLVEIDKNSLNLVVQSTQTRSKVRSEAIDRAYQQLLQKGIDSVRTTSFADRPMHMSMIAIDEEDIPMIREKMRAFHFDLIRQLATRKKKNRLFAIATLAYGIESPSSEDHSHRTLH